MNKDKIHMALKLNITASSRHQRFIFISVRKNNDHPLLFPLRTRVYNSAHFLTVKSNGQVTSNYSNPPNTLAALKANVTQVSAVTK